MAWMKDIVTRSMGAALSPDPMAGALCLAMGDAVIAFDSSSNVINVRGDSWTILKATQGSLLGQGLFRRINVADKPAFLKALSDCMRGTKTASAIVRMRIGESDAPGQEVQRWIEARFACLDNNAMAVLRDVDANRVREDQIVVAQRMAAEASDAKDRFLATVSHELRTPLNAIIGFSEILASDAVGPVTDERRKEYATIIRQSGEHLLEVVNMLLDMSKLEAGKFVVEPETFSLKELLGGVCDMMALRAAQAGVDLVRNVPEDIPEIISDRRALRQVLINLVSNAVKFTLPAGRVFVRADVVGGAVNIVIQDSGIGISEEELPKLGTPFFQAKSSYDRSHEGTGLGLSVVRRLMGLLGGTIHLESCLGEGTAITIRLPLDARGLVNPGVVAPLVTSILRRPLSAEDTANTETSPERILKRA